MRALGLLPSMFTHTRISEVVRFKTVNKKPYENIETAAVSIESVK